MEKRKPTMQHMHASAMRAATVSVSQLGPTTERRARAPASGRRGVCRAARAAWVRLLYRRGHGRGRRRAGFLRRTRAPFQKQALREGSCSKELTCPQSQSEPLSEDQRLRGEESVVLGLPHAAFPCQQSREARSTELKAVASSACTNASTARSLSILIDGLSGKDVHGKLCCL